MEGAVGGRNSTLKKSQGCGQSHPLASACCLCGNPPRVAVGGGWEVLLLRGIALQGAVCPTLGWGCQRGLEGNSKLRLLEATSESTGVHCEPMILPQVDFHSLEQEPPGESSHQASPNACPWDPPFHSPYSVCSVFLPRVCGVEDRHSFPVLLGDP